MTREAELAYWIIERDNIRIRREAGQPPPWTKDPLMANVRYCNVRREDDKVTRYLADEWRSPTTPTYAIVAARMINLIPTLQAMKRAELSHPGNAIAEWKRACRQRQLDMKKVFTSAYTISTCGQAMDKLDYVFDQVVSAVAEAGEPKFDSLASCHADLTRINGLGSFLAAQVVADLKNTPGHPLRTAPDWQTWAAPGPGSLRGLSAFYGAPIAPSGFDEGIAGSWEATRPLLPLELQDLHMQDFQNCLCEFSKYIRVKEGNGHVRNKYRPGGD